MPLNTSLHSIGFRDTTHDPCTKQESSVYVRKGAARRQKVRQAKSVGKVVLIAFFDYQGMIYQQIVPRTKPKTTVNADYYIGVLKKLREHIHKKRSEIEKNWILHNDNAKPHTATKTKDFLAKMKIRGPAAPTIQSRSRSMRFLAVSSLKTGVTRRILHHRSSSRCSLRHGLQGVATRRINFFHKMGVAMAEVH